jgi:hypothetical protein
MEVEAGRIDSTDELAHLSLGAARMKAVQNDGQWDSRRARHGRS